MKTYAEKDENKSRASANSLTTQKNNSKSTFQFVDNRPEAIAQRKIQEMVDNSSKVAELRAFQNSTQTKQVAQLQAITNNHSVPRVQRQANNNIIQLVTRRIAIQNKMSDEEVDDLKSGAKELGQVVHRKVLDLLSGSEGPIGEDDDIIIVAHGNTESIGDERNKKHDINISPKEAARVLGHILPTGFKGKITLHICHAAEKPPGGKAVAHRIAQSLGEYHLGGSVVAYRGEVSSEMGPNATTTYRGKEKPLSQSEVHFPINHEKDKQRHIDPEARKRRRTRAGEVVEPVKTFNGTVFTDSEDDFK